MVIVPVEYELTFFPHTLHGINTLTYLSGYHRFSKDKLENSKVKYIFSDDVEGNSIVKARI